MKRWSDKNREAKRARDLAYNSAQGPAIYARKRAKWTPEDKEAMRQYQRAWYLNNRERMLTLCKAAREARKAADPEAFRAKVAAKVRRQRLNDPRYRLHQKISRSVTKTLKRHRTSKQGKTWPKLVGYDIKALERRLRATIPRGYKWDDYLSGVLELDHIIPASVFHFTSADDIDFRRCWALSNLQLLPKPANQEKSAKLSAPFQPSLALSSPRGAV
jgi:hypothetical protein